MSMFTHSRMEIAAISNGLKSNVGAPFLLNRPLYVASNCLSFITPRGISENECAMFKSHPTFVPRYEESIQLDTH